MGDLERRFDELVVAVASRLDRRAAAAFERACRSTGADLKVLSVHVFGRPRASGPLPALVPREVELPFELPVHLGELFLEELVEIGRALDRVVSELPAAGWQEPDPMGRAVASSAASFWAHSFVHLKLPLWRAHPDLNPFLAGERGSAVQRVASSRLSVR